MSGLLYASERDMVYLFGGAYQNGVRAGTASDKSQARWMAACQLSVDGQSARWNDITWQMLGGHLVEMDA